MSEPIELRIAHEREREEELCQELRALIAAARSKGHSGTLTVEARLVDGHLDDATTKFFPDRRFPEVKAVGQFRLASSA